MPPFKTLQISKYCIVHVRNVTKLHLCTNRQNNGRILAAVCGVISKMMISSMRLYRKLQTESLLCRKQAIAAAGRDEISMKSISSHLILRNIIGFIVRELCYYASFNSWADRTSHCGVHKHRMETPCACLVVLFEHRPFVSLFSPL